MVPYGTELDSSSQLMEQNSNTVLHLCVVFGSITSKLWTFGQYMCIQETKVEILSL